MPDDKVMRAARHVPEWALAALAACGPLPDATRDKHAAHATVSAAIARRWPELTHHFLPCIAQLSAPAKSYVLERALLAAQAVHAGSVGHARQRERQVLELNSKIVQAARRLRDLLDEQRTVERRSGVRSTDFDLWDVLERACQRDPAYREWWEVAGAAAFFRKASGQSRPGPELVDFMAALADECDPAAVDSPYSAATAASRKSTADPVRFVLAAVEPSALHHPDLPEALRLTDEARAELVSVLLDVDVSGDQVKQLRARGNDWRENAPANRD